MAHEPVVSFVEPEPELERDGEHGTEKETSSEVTVSHVLPLDGEPTTTGFTQ